MSYQEIDDALNAQIEPPAPEPEETETPDAPESGADVESAAGLILGKYRTPDDAIKAHAELQPQYTRATQEIAELKAQIEALQQPAAEPEQVDPWGYLGSTMDAETEQQLANKIYQDPQGSMEWALRPEVQQQFGANIADRVYATWYGLQPFAAQTWVNRHTASQDLAEQRAALEEVRANQTRDLNERSATAARNLIDQAIPDFAQHKDRVVELMDMFPLADDHPLNQTPEGLAQYTRMLTGIARDEAFERAQQEHPTQPASAAPQAAKARTQQRSTATAGKPAAVHPDDAAMVESLISQVSSGDF